MEIATSLLNDDIEMNESQMNSESRTDEASTSSTTRPTTEEQPKKVFYRSVLHRLIREIRVSGSEGKTIRELANVIGGPSMCVKPIHKAISHAVKLRPDSFKKYVVHEGRNVTSKYVWAKNFVSQENNPDLKLFESMTGITPKMNSKFILTGSDLKSLTLTERTLRRLNFTLQYLRDNLVIERHKLQKAVTKNDFDTGYFAQIDRRTVQKIAQYLQMNGQLQIINTIRPLITKLDHTVTISLYAVPEIPPTDPLVLQTIEQACEEASRKRMANIQPPYNRQKNGEGQQPKEKKSKKMRQQVKTEVLEHKVFFEEVPSEFNHVEPLSDHETLESSSNCLEADLAPDSINDVVNDVAARNTGTQAKAEVKKAQRSKAVQLPEWASQLPEIQNANKKTSARGYRPKLRRPMDHVDIESQLIRKRLRVRFSRKERDKGLFRAGLRSNPLLFTSGASVEALPMPKVPKFTYMQKNGYHSRFQRTKKLFFMRAVCVFLYPTYRLVVDPTVVRDIMHDEIPESRDKTTSGLLAAMNKDIQKSKARSTQLKRLVGQLASIPELQRIKDMGIHFGMTAARREQIFRQAYTIAKEQIMESNTALTKEINCDEDLLKLAELGTLLVPDQLKTVKAETDGAIPWLKKSIDNEDDIFAITMHMMLLGICSVDMDVEREYIPLAKKFYSMWRSEQLTEVMNALRMQGILVKKKSYELPPSLMSLQNGELTFSQYYRYFFNDRTSPQLHFDKINLCADLQGGGWADVMREAPIAVPVVSAKIASNNICFDLTLPEKLILTKNEQEAGEDDDGQSTPSRHAAVPSTLTGEETAQEAARSRIHFEKFLATKMRLSQFRQERFEASLTADKRTVLPQTSQLEIKPCQLYARVVHQYHVSPLVQASDPFAQLRCLVKQKPTEKIDTLSPNEVREKMQQMISFIGSKGVYGATFEEILANVKDACKADIDWLRRTNHVLRLGAMEPLYVLLENTDPWTLSSFEGKIDNRGKWKIFVPRPWIKLDGDLNLSIVRYMAQGVYLAIVARPGITHRRLLAHFKVVLLPVVVIEVLEFLIDIGCVVVKQSEVTQPVISAAFEPITEEKLPNEDCYLPAIEGHEAFQEIFKNIPIPELFTLTNSVGITPRGCNITRLIQDI